MHFRNRHTYLILALIISLAGLLIYASLAMYVRPEADDMYYITADGSNPEKTFDFMINGRLPTLLYYGLFYRAPFALQLAPLVGIIITLLGFYFLIKSLLRTSNSANARFRLISWTTASVATLTTFILTPGLFTSLYWFSASPVHVWPYGLLMVYVGLIIGYKHTKRTFIKDVLLFILLPFVAGMCYETVSVLAIIISLTVIMFAYRGKLSDYIRIGWYGLAASIASFLVLYYAPGTVHRREVVGRSSGALNSTVDRVLELPGVMWHNFTQLPTLFPNYLLLLVIAALAAITALFFVHKRLLLKKGIWIIAFTSGAALSLHFLNVAIVFVGLGTPPPLRAYFLTSLLFISAAIAAGTIAGFVVQKLPVRQRHIALGALFATALIIPLGHSVYLPTVRDFRSEIKAHSAEWDRRDAHIKELLHKNKCKIPVKDVSFPGIVNMNKKPYAWQNDAINDYYGVDKPCRIYARS